MQAEARQTSLTRSLQQLAQCDDDVLREIAVQSADERAEDSFTPNATTRQYTSVCSTCHGTARSTWHATRHDMTQQGTSVDDSTRQNTTTDDRILRHLVPTKRYTLVSRSSCALNLFSTSNNCRTMPRSKASLYRQHAPCQRCGGEARERTASIMGYSDTMEILGARKSEPKWEIERQMTRGGRRVVCV